VNGFALAVWTGGVLREFVIDDLGSGTLLGIVGEEFT
jgi:hypothetical protein